MYANHKSSSRLPFGGCPLRPRHTAPQPRGATGENNALLSYTVPSFFPHFNPHTTSPTPSSPFNSNSKFNSTQIQIRLCPPSFPSATCLCARANLCLTKAPEKRQMRRASPSEHILTIGSSPGPPAVRPPFRHHGGCFLFDLAAGSMALEKIGNGHTLARAKYGK